jgi:hypothetical protein
LDFSDTVDRKNLEEYKHRCRELKSAIDYKEPLNKTIKKEPKSDIAGDGVIKEIKQLHSAKYTKELRKELFDGRCEQIKRFHNRLIIISILFLR